MTKPRLPDPEPPCCIPAEKALLGAITVDNTLFSATGSLEADDFFLAAHRTIYSRAKEMLASGEAVNLITLVEAMRDAKELDGLGEIPVAYIAGLSEDTLRYRPSVKDWAKIIKGKSLLRRLIAACSEALTKAYNGEPGRDIIAALKYQLEEIESTAKRGMGA